MREELLAAVTRVCDSQHFILGAEVEQLEAELAAAIGSAHAIGVSSGTDALLVAMMALGIGPGDEVITPTFSFFATAGCAARLGATPVFVDIDPATFNVDVDAVRRSITARTRAVIPVHLFGQCAEMDPLMAVAAEHGIPIIEDAAQALGALYRGRQAGTIGAVGCFSFFPSKNLGAFGDGGLVTTDDGRLAARIRRLRNHGAEPKYFHREIGGNFRLDALQAAVLRVKLPHLQAWHDGRRANAARYRELFAQTGTPGSITLPVEAPERTHIFNQFVVRVAGGRRDELRAYLGQHGVGTEVYYPVPFHRQECFAHLAPVGQAFPHADRAAAEVLALPIYPELSAAQQAHVVQTIAEWAS